MENRPRRINISSFVIGFGSAALIAALLVGILLLTPLSISIRNYFQDRTGNSQALSELVSETVTPISTTATPIPEGTPLLAAEDLSENPISPERLKALYRQASPGVVSINVTIQQGGLNQSGTGSGFIYDQDGHIITNNHVVNGADLLIVVFSDGTQARAEIVGTDDDSDLAVIGVEEMPQAAHPLPLGDSDQAAAGDWVIAIGNPFGLNSSMTVGIISAVGRTIPSGATPFSIPEAIQTDASINPGNSGGPLLNTSGQVIGVNAQIASGGQPANAGVGFAIPTSILQRVAPLLIEAGDFQWAWLGIRGTSVDLLISETNSLPSQKGALVVEVVPNSPAEQAGLRGATGAERISGIEVPTGGDVITGFNGSRVNDYTDLLSQITDQEPGAEIDLTVYRDGDSVTIPVTLAPRVEAVTQ